MKMKKLVLSLLLALTPGVLFAQAGSIVRQYDFAGRTLYKADNGRQLAIYGSGAPTATTFGAENITQGVVYVDTATGGSYYLSGSSWVSQYVGSAFTTAINAAAGLDCNTTSTTACRIANGAAGPSLVLAGTTGNLTLTAVTGNYIESALYSSGAQQRTVNVTVPKTVTDNVATAIFNVTGLGLHRAFGGTFEFCVRVSDATNDQVACGRTFWAGVDTTAGAGGETCTNLIVGTVSAALTGAASSGTLTVTASATTGTDLCSYLLTADTSLTPTVMEVTYRVEENVGMTSGAVTVVPQ